MMIAVGMRLGMRGHVGDGVLFTEYGLMRGLYLRTQHCSILLFESRGSACLFMRLVSSGKAD